MLPAGNWNTSYFTVRVTVSMTAWSVVSRSPVLVPNPASPEIRFPQVLNSSPFTTSVCVTSAPLWLVNFAEAEGAKPTVNATTAIATVILARDMTILRSFGGGVVRSRSLS